MRISGFFSAAKVSPIDATGATIAAAATLAFFFGVIGPLNAHNRQVVAHFQTVARERQRLAGVVTEIRTVSKDLTAMRAQIAASPLHVLTQEALNQRLADLTALSSACGLVVADLKPNERLQTAHFSVVPVEMTGHGTYRNCAIFIHLLHDRLTDIDVHAFRLAGTPQEPGGDGNFDFELRWIAAPPETPAAPSAATAALP